MSQEILPAPKKLKFCNETLRLEKDIRTVYLDLGERLYTIRQQELYKPQWESWEEFCMEFRDLSGSSISKMIKVYELFVLKFRYDRERLVEAGGWTKLYAISMYIKSKEDAEEWLLKSTTLSKRDLEIEVTEARTGVEQRGCKHKDTYQITVCRGCGMRSKEE